MHVITVWVLLLLFAVGETKRIALTDSETPTTMLCTGSSNMPVQWSSAEMSRWMHESEVVEIGPRGIRFVSMVTYSRKEKARDVCESTHMALCESRSGLVLPTTGTVRVTGMMNPQFNSSIAKYFYEESDASCAQNGDGRVKVLNETVYTVSACDIMEGRAVIMYRPTSDEILVISQTFGPMAYSVILVTALCCIYGASVQVNKENWWVVYVMRSICGGGSVACCLLYVMSGITFLCQDDEAHFWLSIVGTWIMILCGGAKSITNMSMFMLGSIADALYRGPETPYASIFVVALGVQTWQKVFGLCFELVGWRGHLDSMLTILYLCATIELGLVPQYTDNEDWPIYGGLGALVTFVVAWSMRQKSE